MAGVAVNWFEIPAQDLARATKFYETVLGVTLGEMESPAGTIRTFINDGMPTGAIAASEHNSPSKTGSLLFLNTDDIDAVIGKVKSVGGEVLMPKTSIGEHGAMAQFVDSEGNRVALHSHAA